MTPNTPTPAPAPLELLQVDPASLTVRDQVRTDATPDEGLIASVRKHGIIQPPVVERTADGTTYVIVTGHRRVGAAIAAGLPSIDVIVRAAGEDADLTLEQQIVENERRRGLSAQELARGYADLEEMFGRTPEEIAAALGENADRVRAGIRTARSSKTVELLQDAPSIDLEKAAIIAEFDEHPTLQKRLVETATTRPENFARDVESTRADLKLADAVDQLKTAIAADGTTWIQTLPYTASWWTGKNTNTTTGSALDRLVDADGTEITPEAHHACPGHAAIIHRASSYDAAAGTGPEILYVCTDWEANGHARPTHTTQRTAEQIERDEQLAREREERARRQQIIDANTRARRTWIHGHLTTGRLRPAAAHFDILAQANAAQLQYDQSIDAHATMEILTDTPRERDTWSQHPNADEYTTLVTKKQAPSLRLALAAAFATLDGLVATSAGFAYYAAIEQLGYTLTDTDCEHLAAARTELEAEDAFDGEGVES